MNNAPIFIINLERSTQRRSVLEKRLTELGLDYRFVAATDGSKLTPDEQSLPDRHIRSKFARTPLTNSEIGCYLSHMKLWRRIIESKLDWAVIMEDDLLIEESLPNILDKIGKLTIAWDLIRLAGLFTVPTKSIGSLDNNHTLNMLLNTACGAQAYCLSKRGAEKLLAKALPIVRPVDNTMDRYWENNLTILAIQPYPVQQDESGTSEIGEERRLLAKQKKLKESTTLRWSRRWRKWQDSMAKRRKNITLLILAITLGKHLSRQQRTIGAQR